MDNLSNQEHKIVSILLEKFTPQAIILVGSQVEGGATAQSDWDVFLFCNERRAGIELQEDNLSIDVNFSAWPKEDSYFDTGFGPVHPLKTLFDASQGRLEKLIANTEASYKKGPLELQPEISTLNLRSFERYVEKLMKYENDEVAQFYYKGMFFNKFLVVWFEQQNIWAAPPVKALAILKDTEPKMYGLFQILIDRSGAEVSAIITALAHELALKITK